MKLFDFFKQKPPLSFLTEEERKIFYEAGCFGSDTIINGLRKLLAEIKRLKEG